MKLCARDWFRGPSQAVAVEPRTPQSRFPLHDHEFGEIVIVRSGHGWHVLDGEPQLITRGEVLYVSPEDRHAFEEVSDLCLTNVIYRPSDRLLRPEKLRSLLGAGDAGGRRCWQVTGAVLQELQPLLDRLGAEAGSAEPLGELMAESLFLELAVLLRRNRFTADGAEVPPDQRLGAAISYLRRHCAEELSLEGVARRFGFSPRNFNRVFRQATSSSPQEFVAGLRLGRALQALRRTDESITEIAYSCGFGDSNYFSARFARMTGLSPRAFRERSRALAPRPRGLAHDAPEEVVEGGARGEADALADLDH